MNIKTRLAATCMAVAAAVSAFDAALTDPLAWLYADSKIATAERLDEIDVPSNGVVDANILVNGLKPGKRLEFDATFSRLLNSTRHIHGEPEPSDASGAVRETGTDKRVTPRAVRSDHDCRRIEEPRPVRLGEARNCPARGEERRNVEVVGGEHRKRRGEMRDAPFLQRIGGGVQVGKSPPRSGSEIVKALPEETAVAELLPDRMRIGEIERPVAEAVMRGNVWLFHAHALRDA